MGDVTHRKRQVRNRGQLDEASRHPAEPMLEDVGDADVIICVEQVVTDARFHRSHQINNLPHRPRVSVNVAPLFVCLPTKAGETHPDGHKLGHFAFA